MMAVRPKFIENKQIVELTIPEDYAFETYISLFHKQNRTCDRGIKAVLTDQNFKTATTKLVPGKTYFASQIKVMERVSLHECLGLLRRKNSLLVGAQGALMMYDLHRHTLAKDCAYISLDEQDSFPVIDGDSRVPFFFFVKSKFDYVIKLCAFRKKINRGFVLFCFSEKTTT